LKRLLILFFLSIVFISSAFSQKSEPVTKIKTYVTDEAGVLSASDKETLENKLAAFEQTTSNQVVVYVTSSLNGEPLEEVSYEIAEKNGIGQKGKDNGVLLFIAISDRKLRIEVGYGLEGALPDALSDQIIRKEITPSFKQGKYYEGINAGVDAIIKATKGEYVQDKQTDKSKKNIGIGFCGLPILVIVIFIFFGFFFIISIIRRIFGWKGGGRSGWWNSGGWSSGSGSGWSSGSSSGFSGGGFSGGGGSFGGGGSSGSW
jgi:uncharacterized protein